MIKRIANMAVLSGLLASGCTSGSTSFNTNSPLVRNDRDYSAMTVSDLVKSKTRGQAPPTAPIYLGKADALRYAFCDDDLENLSAYVTITSSDGEEKTKEMHREDGEHRLRIIGVPKEEWSWRLENGVAVQDHMYFSLPRSVVDLMRREPESKVEIWAKDKESVSKRKRIN